MANEHTANSDSKSAGLSDTGRRIAERIRERDRVSGNGRENGSGDGTTIRTSDGSAERDRAIASDDSGAERNDSATASAVSSDGIGDTSSSAGSGSRRSRGRPRGSRNRSDGDIGVYSERAETESGASANVRLNFDNVFQAGESKKRGRPRKSKLDIPGLSNGVKLLYNLPPIVFNLTGYTTPEHTHEHWQLSDTEAESFTEAFVNACGTVSDKRFLQFLATLEKIAPWGMLCMTAWIITAPRVQESQKILSAINDERRAQATVHATDSRVIDFTRPKDTDTDAPAN